MTERFVKVAMCLLPAVALALGGCEKRDETLPDDVTTALETAFNRGDVNACVDVYTEDAEIIPEDGPVVRGRQAIREFFKDQVQRDTSFDTDSTLSIVRRDLAIEQGTYRVRDVKRGIDVEWGEYLNVWRRINGNWRVLRSMYNVTVAPRGAVSVSSDEENAAPAPPQSQPQRPPPPIEH